MKDDQLVELSVREPHPWWLPQGSIRALLAIIIVVGAVYLCIKLEALEALVGLAATATWFYFEMARRREENNRPKE